MTEVILKPGWLKRQLENVAEDVKGWPAWMRRSALTPTMKNKLMKNKLTAIIKELRRCALENEKG